MQVSEYRGEASGPFMGSTGSLTGVTALSLLSPIKSLETWWLKGFLLSAAFSFLFPFTRSFLSFLSFTDVFSLSTRIYLFISFFCSSGSGALPDVFDKTQTGNWLTQGWHDVCACTHTCQNNYLFECHIFFFGSINYQSQHSFLACTFPSSLLSFGVLDPL